MTAPVFTTADDGARDSPDPVGGSFLEPLVDRLHAQYGGDRQAIRRLALDSLAAFADARVQAFVPVLVEKRLRELYRSAPRPA